MTTPHPGPKCGARTRAGDTCGQHAGWGTDHPGYGRCKLHGGSTPGGRAIAQRLAIEDAARALGVPVVHDPAQGILDELHRTLGELLWLRELVRAEAGSDAVDSLFHGTQSERVKVTVDGTEVTTDYGPGLNEKLKTYERWKRIYRDTCAVALAHGIAQRQLDVAEHQAEVLGMLVSLALDTAGVHGEARTRALTVARDRFMEIGRQAAA